MCPLRYDPISKIWLASIVVRSISSIDTRKKSSIAFERKESKRLNFFHLTNTQKLFFSRRSSSTKRPVLVEPTETVDTSIITTSAFKSRTPWSAPMRANSRRNTCRGGSNIHPHHHRILLVSCSIRIIAEPWGVSREIISNETRVLIWSGGRACGYRNPHRTRLQCSRRLP